MSSRRMPHSMRAGPSRAATARSRCSGSSRTTRSCGRRNCASSRRRPSPQRSRPRCASGGRSPTASAGCGRAEPAMWRSSCQRGPRCRCSRPRSRSSTSRTAPRTPPWSTWRLRSATSCSRCEQPPIPPTNWPWSPRSARLCTAAVTSSSTTGGWRADGGARSPNRPQDSKSTRSPCRSPTCDRWHAPLGTWVQPSCSSSSWSAVASSRLRWPAPTGVTSGGAFGT